MKQVKHLERRYFGNQIGVVMEGRTIMMCLKCGALVAASEVHIRFHEQLGDQLPKDHHA